MLTNRNALRLLLLVLLVAGALAVFSVGVLAQLGSEGKIRFMHAVPGAPEIDVYVGGELTATMLDFGEATGYINVPAGNQTVTVTVAGLATVLWEQDVDVADSPLLLLASDPDSPQFAVFPESLEPLAPGTTRFAVVHAIAGGPAVQVVADGDPVGASLAYGEYLGTFDVPSAVFELSGEAEGTIVVPPMPTGLISSTAQTLVVYGTSDVPESLLLTAPTLPAEDAGFVRIAHTVLDAPAVDVVIPGESTIMLAPGLEFGEYTEHLALPAGTYDVELRESGTQTALLGASLTVEAGVAATVAAVGTVDTLEVSVFADDISGVTADTVVLNVVNTISGDSSVDVDFADGTAVAAGVAFNAESGPIVLDPSIQTPVVTFSLDGMSATLELDEVVLYGGVYYNVIAVDGTMFSPPTLLFAPTVLAQSIGSAPGAGEMMLVEAPVAEEPAEEAAVETPEPAAQPTPAPAVTEVPEQPQAPTTVEVEGPTARVNLNADANLQLRIFPRADAESLGLAPSGSVLAVIGREGAPQDLDGNLLTVEDADGNAVDWVDPATLLPDEDSDLVPADTWLYVTYATPDGGSITAWVNAEFLIVRDNNGDLQRLAELETIPLNREGEAIGTDITPPPPREDVITAIVIGLNEGANLNLRRTPETSGEVLAAIPNGTVMEFIGVPVVGGEDSDEPVATATPADGVTLEDWVFVRYLPPEGGSITGWVYNLYVTYERNGEAVLLDELFARDLVEAVDAETAGAVSVDAPEFEAPTPDPLRDAYVATVELDPGANLNLRRTPDAQSEVLVQVPSGSQIIVSGRTSDGEWLETSFEGFSGWVASAFTSLTFNDQSVDIEEIPITGDDAG